MPTPLSTANDQSVTRLLGELRGRIRTYVWAEALLGALLFLGGVFWGGLLLDWMFEPSPSIRLAVHVVVATVVGAMLLWWGVRRWIVRLSDHSLALLVERLHPELAERLSTSIDLQQNPERAAELHPELVARTQQAAAESAADLELEIGNVLDRPRLHRFAAGAAGLVLSVVVLAIIAPQVWATYTGRLALSPDGWPRSVQLSIEGFEPDGQGGYVRKVARNSDVPIVVEANLADGLKAPSRVTIRYRWNGGQRGRDDLVRIGTADPTRDAAQRYEYLFERITGSLTFDIRGGDDRLRRYRIEVVERPKVTSLQFACHYPEYLNRKDRQIAVGPRVELPEGTRLLVTGKANKPLQQIHWQQTSQPDDQPVTNQSATEQFSSTLELGANDIEMEVSLLDADGIESAEPFRVTLVAKRDQTPQVLVDRQGIGVAVTPNARLPLLVTIEDDYRVDSAWIDLQLGDESLPRIPLTLPPNSREDLSTLTAIDLRQLSSEGEDSKEPAPKFAPGNRLTIVASAADRYDLDDLDDQTEGGPEGEKRRAGKARALTFEIVTEEELVARLNSTEQNLRQTFESVADKLLVQYDAVDQMEGKDFTATAAAREADRLAENARQMADEILGIASGFEDIHAQLLNNRIDDSELASRIAGRIAKPLRQLGSKQMPKVAEAMQAIGGDESIATSKVNAAKSETRKAIAEVEEILREMQGLESYNEVIAMLREIIRQHEKVTDKTKEKQKDDLRDLLLD